MKKLLLFPALFIATNTTFATQQDDIAAVMAKTKYKNIMTFLGAVSTHPDFCMNGIVYDADSMLVVNFVYNGVDVKMQNSTKDTIYFCRNEINCCIFGKYTTIENVNNITYYSYNYSDSSMQSFILFNDTLRYYGIENQKYFKFPKNTTLDVSFIHLAYCNDNMLHISIRNFVFVTTETAQKINVKYELIDNDINGRAALTNLTPNDSVFYLVMDKNYNCGDKQKFMKYLYFDTIPYAVSITNYYKGCWSNKYIYYYDATEMPRIHDTIKVEVVKDTVIHDTIYITKNDTILPQTAVSDAKAIELNIYPNPTTSFVSVEADNEFSYMLTNVNGRLLKKEENESSYMLDLAEYPEGVYLLITSDGVTHKIIKE